MSQLNIILPDGTEIPGTTPLVIVGPNGSGKTRLSRQLKGRGANDVPEFVNALRSTRLGEQLPTMSRVRAQQDHQTQRNNARNVPWELAADFHMMLAELLADDADAARQFRERALAGESIAGLPTSALQCIQQLWRDIFPGRTLSWQDWTPIVENEMGASLTYSASQMSDGERAALYLLAKVLLAPSDRILVIDEPETHFHPHLAIRLWDALEQNRRDLRFVYVTHDLTFALSRSSANFVIADPRSGLVPVELDSTLPAEIRREILGAASFSYFASRVVFCEGEDQSLDKQFYAAWFRGRDTVVIPVGSCEAVRHCVQSLNRAKLIENLDATGIIDRDFRPEEFFARPAEGIVVIPVHEIEGLLCWPRLAERLARHLGKEITETEIASLVRSRITDEQVRRVVLERTRGRLLDQAQDIVQLKPRDWDERSLRAHLATLEMRLGTIGNATMIFDEELATVSAIRASGDVGEILRTFPSKPIAGSVAKQLGMSVEDLFALMGRALRTSDASDAMGVLGCDLAGILANLGLPQRSVRERTITVAAAN